MKGSNEKKSGSSKFVTFLSVVLVCVTVLGLFTSLLGNFGSSGVPPDRDNAQKETILNGVTLSYKVNPFYNIGNADDSVLLNDDKNTVTVPESANSDCYACITLTDSNQSITVSEYTYVTVEFDVTVPEGYEPLECRATLLGRSVSNAPYSIAASNIYFKADGSGFYALNSDKSKMTAPTELIHIKYVITSGNNDSVPRLQVFFNGILYYDYSDSETPVFDETYPNINEIRVKQFSGNGAISFTNLKVCGYTETVN